MNTRPNASFQDLRDWISSYIAARGSGSVTELDPSRRFVQLGLDSLSTMAMMMALRARLGRDLPATLVWDHPTPNALAAHLAGEPSPASSHSRRRQASAGSRLSAEQRAAGEPIAIVGLAGRFAGAQSARSLWQHLLAGSDLITELSAQRARLEGYDPEGPAVHAGFMPRVDEFDPGFFEITRAESLHMDPQQRLLLELAWELFLDAGVSPESLHGSATGVFIGAMWNDYARLPRGGHAHIRPQTALGFDLSGLSARLSYGFGLHGPSLTLNTACSSSLVAVHLACAALARGEAELAIAGGINLIIGPESSALMQRFGAMAPDARCKAFDARANGYVRGEGAGLVLLMPLAAAILGGHPIYCMMRGSAVNNDGASNGITAPNPGAQVEVLRQAYANANIDPASVDYVEAHGTGTLLGDPIEARALGAALCVGRERPRALRIGSVKTNIGHLESAAGVAGLIKVALALAHQTLPASLHFAQPNPHIPFEELGLRVQARREGASEPEARLLRAGVSGFGFGGTNCHVVLERFDDDARLIEIRARDREAAIAELGSRLQRGPHTLHGLADMEPRDAEAASGPITLAFRAHTLGEVERVHAGLRAGEAALHDLVGARRPNGAPLLLVFSGQGGQWAGMARGLLRAAPAFRSQLQRCRDALRAHVDWDLLEELIHPSEACFNDIAFVQPALFSYQVSVVAELEAQGFHPDLVLGHSMGEVAAAFVAGILSLEDAVRVIAVRSALMARTSADGAMLAVDWSPEEAKARLADWPGVEVGVINGARNIILSGARSRLEALAAREQLVTSAPPAERAPDSPRARWINVRVASHSPQMDGILPTLQAEFSGVVSRVPRVPMISTVRGGLLDVPTDATYWCDNLRRPVQFARALAHVLLNHADLSVLEVSPHPVLSEPIKDAVRDSSRAGPARAAIGHVVIAHSGQRDEPETATLYENLALLARHGGQGTGRRAPTHSVPVVVPISAHAPAAVRPTLEALAGELERMGSLRDVAHSLALRSAHQRHRVALVASSKGELESQLSALLAAPSPPCPPATRARPPRVVLVYPGLAAEWRPVGTELALVLPAFAADYREALTRVGEHLGCERAAALDLREVPLEPQWALPALFSFQVALTRLFERFGVQATTILAEGSGELAAAWAARALSFDAACRLTALRSSSSRGAARSPAPAPAADEELWRQALAFEPQPASIPLLSTLDARETGEPGLPAQYWSRAGRTPLALSNAVERLVEAGCDVWLELAPGPQLARRLSQLLGAHPGCEVLSAVTEKAPVRGPFNAAARLYAAGVALSWPGVLGFEGRAVPLPAPAWQRESLWLEPVAPSDRAAGATLAAEGAGARPAVPIDWATLPVGGVSAELASIFSGIVESCTERIDFKRSFFDLGMDSTMAVLFAQRVGAASGITLGAAAIFEYDTLSGLTAYVVRRLQKPQGARLAS